MSDPDGGSITTTTTTTTRTNPNPPINVDDYMDEETDDDVPTDDDMDPLERRQLQDELLRYNVEDRRRQNQRYNEEILNAAAFNEIEETLAWMDDDDFEEAIAAEEERIREREEQRQLQDVRRLEQEEKEEEEALQAVQEEMEVEQEIENRYFETIQQRQEAMAAFLERQPQKWLTMFAGKIYDFYLIQDRGGRRRGDKVTIEQVQAENLLPFIVRRAVVLRRRGVSRANNNNNLEKTLTVGMIVYELMNRSLDNNNNMVTIFYSIQQDDMTVDILRNNGYGMTRVPRNIISPMPELGYMDRMGLDRFLGCKNYSRAKDAQGNNIVVGKIPNSVMFRIGSTVLVLFGSKIIYDIRSSWITFNETINTLSATNCTYVTEDRQTFINPECQMRMKKLRDSLEPQCRLLDESMFSLSSASKGIFLGFIKAQQGAAVTTCDAIGNQSRLQLYQWYVKHLALVVVPPFNNSLGLCANLVGAYTSNMFSTIWNTAFSSINSAIQSLIDSIAEMLKNIHTTLSDIVSNSKYLGSCLSYALLYGITIMFNGAFNFNLPPTMPGLLEIPKLLSLMYVQSTTSANLFVNTLLSVLWYVGWYKFLMVWFESICPMLLWSANQLQNCRYYQPKPKKKNELQREMLDALVKLKF